MLEPGVYVGLPESEYHAQPALSASGIKNLMVSPLDFWARSWMNPLGPEESSDTFAMMLGRAFHKRIVEGKDAFYGAYAAELDPKAYPTALRTNDELKAALQACGEKVGGNKADLIERLLAADPSCVVWDRLVQEHAEKNAGRVMLDGKLIEKIEIAAAMIEKHPQLSKCFSGGLSELSVFWTDPETNVPMKARLDYLKVMAIVDLKTFSNPLMKPVDRAIAGAMASGKYHIQAGVYFEAAEWIARHAKAGRVFCHSPEQKDFLARCAEVEPDKRQFVFVFQQTGLAPVARGKVFPRGLVHDCAMIAIREAQRKFVEYREAFGEGPWVDIAEIVPFDDAEFPAYMTE